MLQDANMEDEVVVAGYLHDMIEDCGYSQQQLAEETGNPRVAVAELVEETIRMIANLKILADERREATREGDLSKLMVINGAEKALRKKINGVIKNDLWFMRSSLYGLKRVSQIFRMM